MADKSGRSIKAVIADIAEGLISVNPLHLKSYNEKTLQELYSAITKKQTEIRSEPFPVRDPAQIRNRNVRLQRLFGAQTVIKNYARERNYRTFKG